MDKFGDVELTIDLLALPFVQTALLAAAILGVVAGVIGPLIVRRQMAFAVPGTAELGFTGAAAALLLGVGVECGAVAGAAAAAWALGGLGAKAAEGDGGLGVGVPFGGGLCALRLGLQ